MLKNTKYGVGGSEDESDYNYCYMIYQVGLVLGMSFSKIKIIEILPLFPGLQFFIFLVMVYMGFQGIGIFIFNDSDCVSSCGISCD